MLSVDRRLPRRFGVREQHHHVLLLARLGLVIPLALSGPVLAQQVSSATNVQPAAQTLGEITVTARRYAENLETVPTAVTALNANALTERGIKNATDLQSAVPGFTVRETENQNNLTFSIRGQTVDAFTGSAVAVPTYMDYVQLNTLGESSLYDLDSVQVLKGPQGTLFGRNATGGAVLYTTAKPTNTLGGYVVASGGNYGANEQQGALNIPVVSNKILLRVAFDIDKQDGYIHDIYHNMDLGSTDRASGRVSLLLRPTEQLSNLTVFEYDQSGGNNIGDEPWYVSPGGSAAGIYGPYLDTLVGVPGAWQAYLKANPMAPGAAADYLAYQHSLGLYTVDNVEGSLHREYGHFVVNTTTYDQSDALEIKNIFGISDDKARDVSSETGTPYGLQYTQNLATGQVGNVVSVKGISDEAQALGLVMQDQLHYTVGAYYQDTKTHILYPQSYFDIAPFGVLSSVTDNFDIDDSTEAIYSQETYDLKQLTGVRGLKLTGGIRYTWETFKLNQLPGGAYYPAAPQERKFGSPSWLAGLSYQLDADTMVYVQGRRSWRSGGFNGVAPAINGGAAQGGDEFSPEVTKDVELGLKFQGPVLGRGTRLNIAAFNQWTDGVQRAEFPSVNGHSIAVTINVPSAVASGAELDAAMKPTDWLELGLSAAYTDARFVNNTSLIFGTLYVFGPYPDTSKYSGSAYGQLRMPVPVSLGEMSIRADLYAQTGQWFSSNGATILPHTRIPGYGLVNMRYNWQDVLGTNLSVALYVKNLADRGYYTGGLAQGVSLGLDAVTVGPPRMFGASVRYDF